MRHSSLNRNKKRIPHSPPQADEDPAYTGLQGIFNIDNGCDEKKD